MVEFLLARRGRERDLLPSRRDVTQQVGCVGEGADTIQVARLEDLAVTRGERVLLRVGDAGDQRGDEQVAALADLIVDARGRDLVSVLAKRVLPRPDVIVVAVDQRAVDVEDDRLRRARVGAARCPGEQPGAGEQRRARQRATLAPQQGEAERRTDAGRDSDLLQPGEPGDARGRARGGIVAEPDRRTIVCTCR